MQPAISSNARPHANPIFMPRTYAAKARGFLPTRQRQGLGASHGHWNMFASLTGRNEGDYMTQGPEHLNPKAAIVTFEPRKVRKALSLLQSAMNREPMVVTSPLAGYTDRSYPFTDVKGVLRTPARHLALDNNS